eukprot:scaffold235477_cov16-Tisochrysis_lutea.AAC.1
MGGSCLLPVSMSCSLRRSPCSLVLCAENRMLCKGALLCWTGTRSVLGKLESAACCQFQRAAANWDSVLALTVGHLLNARWLLPGVDFYL